KWEPVKFGYPLPLLVCSPRTGSGRCPPSLPPYSLLGHVTGPRRLQDHS
ncbi:unnamed protein product, partial [Staurois parvus]